MSAPALTRLRALLSEQGGLMASLLQEEGSPAGGGNPTSSSSVPARRSNVPSQSNPTGSSNLAGRSNPEGPSSLNSPSSLNGAAAGAAQIAAAGPRAQGHAEEYELLMEAIYEGYLLHYGAPRIVCPPEADLGLLAGDQLYALGLARLVALGDLPAVAELADVIALTALAQGEGQDELAQAVWAAGARAVGWGSSDSHRQAKALAHAGEPGALEAMRAAAEPDRH